MSGDRVIVNSLSLCDASCAAKVQGREGSKLALTMVELMLERVLDALRSEKPLAIELARRPRASEHLVSREVSLAFYTVSFPGRTPREAWKFG